MRIYLTGFMGSGKSTAGAIVANVLGVAFEDLDDTIAAEAGRSVARLFEDEGEAAFRARERAALEATARHEAAVIAVGGGALAQPGSMAWARSQGLVVYLALSLDALAERLAHVSTPRPLLLGADGQRLGEQALRERIAGLLAAREPIYRRAHVTLDTDTLALGPMVDAIVAAVRRHGG